MTKEELASFLKKNLEIRVDLRNQPCFGEDEIRIKVQILLEEEMICESFDSIVLNFAKN